MYEQYWKLKEKPFELTPDPRYVYYSQEHEDALMRLFYTIKDLKGAMLLTGLYGCGKTVLSRVFINELLGSKYEVALITNPRLTANELLQEIIYQLGGNLYAKSDSKGELLRCFNEILYSNLNMGKETVLILDEAQAIEKLETFEELRLLLNFQKNDRFLITLILIGQTELRNRLKQLPQLKQRLMIEYHLNPLSEKDCFHYLDHRLRVAGMEQSIFTQDAKTLIYKYSRGVPRVINGMADMGLLEGFSKSKDVVDDKIIRKVIKDSKLEEYKLI